MSFVLYHRRTRPTGRALREALELPGGYGVSRYESGTRLIRWGNPQHPELDSEAEVLNKADAINTARNKLRAFEVLAAAGIPTPEWTRSIDDILPGLEQVVDVWFARQTTGFGGRDITILETAHDLADLQGGWEFFSHYIPSNFELRMHVFGGEVIRYQKKIREDGDTCMVRNHDNGYRFMQPELRPNTERFDTAIKAVAALGLDFGAVDLIVPRDDPEQSVVLEVNTAPACSPLTLSKYVEAFRGIG